MQIRLIPLLFAVFVIAFIDRINVGFAALPMNRELAITSQQFGFAAGVFFFGYFLFEVPSNLLLHKLGARIWFARILITWGTVAALTSFVQTAHELYVARFVLRLAEAGYVPGILLYLSYWFRQQERAQAIALCTVCQHHGRSNFRHYPRSSALARPQQLAMASDFRGISSSNSRR